MRDNRVCVAVAWLGGQQEFVYHLRPTLPGELHMMPARAFAMYDPDRQGPSAELLLKVRDRAIAPPGGVTRP